MAWRFHFPIRNYDFKATHCVFYNRATGDVHRLSGSASNKNKVQGMLLDVWLIKISLNYWRLAKYWS